MLVDSVVLALSIVEVLTTSQRDTAIGQNSTIEAWIRRNVTPTSPKVLYLVGGSRALPSNFPYVVRVQDRLSHTCSGSIISRTWTITAAHCQYPNTDPRQTVVYAGCTDLPVEAPHEQMRNATQIVRHPRYTRKQARDDLSLVQVADPFEWTEHVRPIRIARGPFPRRGELCRTAGWGHTERPEDTKPMLKWVTLFVFHPHMGCLSDSEGGSCCLCMKGEPGNNVCYGDSGGPTVCQGVLVGVNRLLVRNDENKTCGDRKASGVVVYTAKYEDWIRSHATDILRPGVISWAPAPKIGGRLLLGGLTILLYTLENSL